MAAAPVTPGGIVPGNIPPPPVTAARVTTFDPGGEVGTTWLASFGFGCIPPPVTAASVVTFDPGRVVGTAWEGANGGTTGLPSPAPKGATLKVVTPGGRPLGMLWLAAACGLPKVVRTAAWALAASPPDVAAAAPPTRPNPARAAAAMAVRTRGRYRSAAGAVRYLAR